MPGLIEAKVLFSPLDFGLTGRSTSLFFIWVGSLRLLIITFFVVNRWTSEKNESSCVHDSEITVVVKREWVIVLTCHCVYECACLGVLSLPFFFVLPFLYVRMWISVRMSRRVFLNGHQFSKVLVLFLLLAIQYWPKDPLLGSIFGQKPVVCNMCTIRKLLFVLCKERLQSRRGWPRRTWSLRPAGSDPGAVCQKILFLKVSVSLSGFGPSVAHGKLSVRGRCVQATKNKAETCSLLDAIGRLSCGRPRDWV